MNTKLLIATLLMAASQVSWASVRCEATTDLGQIRGQGRTVHEARSMASEKCFDQRLALFQAQRNNIPEGEQADMIVDYCVNLKCKEITN